MISPDPRWMWFAVLVERLSLRLSVDKGAKRRVSDIAVLCVCNIKNIMTFSTITLSTMTLDTLHRGNLDKLQHKRGAIC